MRTLFHLPLSPFCRKVRLVLAEKRLTFDLQVEKVWERRHEYLELNPAATVPTLLEDNGLAVPELSVICEISRKPIRSRCCWARPMPSGSRCGG